MCTKWNKEHQAIWEIYRATIKALRFMGWLTLKEEDEFIDKMQEYIDAKDKIKVKKRDAKHHQ